MKVLHLFYSFPSKWQRYTYETLCRLASAGVGTMAVSAARLEPGEKLDQEAPFPVYCQEEPGAGPARWSARAAALARAWPHRRALKRFVHDRGWAGGLSQFARKAPLFQWRPDVVHLHHSHVLGRDVLTLLGELGIPWIVSLRGSDVMVQPLVDERWREKLQWKLRHATAVHAVSEAVRRRAVELGAPEERVHVIPRALEVVEYSKVAGPPAAPYRLVSVGRLVWEKGHIYAVDAVAALLEEGVPVRYRIVGAGPMEGALRYRAWQLGISDHVELTGYLGGAQLDAEMAGSHLLLHPSLTEAMPNTVIRAQAMGLPVVGSDVGGIPEVVRDGVSGLLTPPARPEQIARAVRACLEPERWDELSRQARQVALERFRPERELHDLIALYRLCAEHGAGATTGSAERQNDATGVSSRAESVSLPAHG